ncbi:MAG TPA: hypothetical protein VGE37_06290, partial [Archangium sp.]
VMAVWYFQAPEARRASTAFYDALLRAAQQRQAVTAETATREAMEESLSHWNRLEGLGGTP